MNALTAFRGDRCGIDNCRSRRYHRADDGLVYCQNGHQSSDTFETQLEDDYVAASQQTTRARPPVTDDAERPSAFLSDRDAPEAFLQCFQYVLQRQAKWVVENTALTDEFETVVRDLWTLHLQLLEPAILSAAGERGEQQLFSSQLSNPDSQAHKPSSISLPKLTSALSLPHCPTLLYLACVMLQFPITLREVLRWLEEESFPYLNIAASLPKALFSRLPLVYRRTFHVRTGLPHVCDLHRLSLRIAGAYASSNLALELPPINFRLILFQIILELRLPLDVYPACLQLGLCLDSSFTLQTRDRDRTIVRLSDHPEVQLMCLLIVTVKLMHPFDGIERFPCSESEPAVLQVDWRKWKRSRLRPSLTNADQEQAQWNIHEDDMFELTGDELDDYMDWFQKIWITADLEDRSRDSDFRKELGRMFPLIDLPHSPRQSSPQRQPTDDGVQRTIQESQTSLLLRPSVPSLPLHKSYSLSRPGTQYTHYRTVAGLPDDARTFFEAVAQLVGLSIQQLVQVTVEIEMKIRRRPQKQ